MGPTRRQRPRLDSTRLPGSSAAQKTQTGTPSQHRFRTLLHADLAAKQMQTGAVLSSMSLLTTMTASVSCTRQGVCPVQRQLQWAAVSLVSVETTLGKTHQNSTDTVAAG